MQQKSPSIELDTKVMEEQYMAPYICAGVRPVDAAAASAVNAVFEAAYATGVVGSEVAAAFVIPSVIAFFGAAAAAYVVSVF